MKKALLPPPGWNATQLHVVPVGPLLGDDLLKGLVVERAFILTFGRIEQI
ncbi:hypothetical protein I546_3095 [Mycobacterium kansasii 732]|nr:hypothetical protein I546_3095 [Mycobacterium kansasii 732]